MHHALKPMIWGPPALGRSWSPPSYVPSHLIAPPKPPKPTWTAGTPIVPRFTKSPNDRKKDWKQFRYGNLIYSYHPRTVMPTFESHPHTVMVLDETVSYDDIRGYCTEELGLHIRDVAIARRQVRETNGEIVNQGFVLHFRDHVPAIQFKLRWNGLDDDTEKRHAVYRR